MGYFSLTNHSLNGSCNFFQYGEKNLKVRWIPYSLVAKWIYFLAIPMGLTFFHLFVLTRLSEWVQGHWLNHVKRLSDTKIIKEGKMLLTVKEGEKIRAENARLRHTIDEITKEHIKEISALRKTNKASLRKLVTPSSSKLKISNVLDELFQSEWNILTNDECYKISKIHTEGGEKYQISREITKQDYDKSIYLNNISKPKGISIKTSFSYDYDRSEYTLNHISWDRNKFQID